MQLLETVKSLFARKDKLSTFQARQLLILNTPLSKVVELYLYDNEGGPQSLDLFPMMRPIYDNLPQKLLLKCSRKTLKSTMISNIIALNMVRYNNYKQLYIGPNEAFTKYFSSKYLSARFESPKLKKILKGLKPNDVFSKTLQDTNSDILLKYANEDATRIRGVAVGQCYYDEIQDMLYEIIPIINETMAMSPFKREAYAGTPLTTDNTIQSMWKTAHQFEWAMRCSGCRHWNTLTIDNEPCKMILEAGFSCSKCARLLDSSVGQWVDFNPGNRAVYGYHMAQPLIPHYNTDPREWKEIFDKCEGLRGHSAMQVHNEVFGLAYDQGAKPITEEMLKALCVLGPMDQIFKKNGRNYMVTAMGCDWGVNAITSRTVGCCVGLREDGVCEVFWNRVFKDTDYEGQISSLARKAAQHECFVACDSGPDPQRGIMLGNQYSPQRTQLVRYEHGKVVQRQESPAGGALDWSQVRWILHRSDCITQIFSMLKKGRIIFPQWEDCSEFLSDLLSVFIEVKEGPLRAELFYRHSAPDDGLHSLLYAVMQVLLWSGDPLLQGSSSSWQEAAQAD